MWCGRGVEVIFPFSVSEEDSFGGGFLGSREGMGGEATISVVGWILPVLITEEDAHSMWGICSVGNSSRQVRVLARAVYRVQLHSAV